MQGSCRQLHSRCFETDPFTLTCSAKPISRGILELCGKRYVANSIIAKKNIITSMVSTPSFDIEATRTCINSGWVRSRSLNRQFVCCLYFWCNYTNLISCVIWKFSDGWTRKVFDPRIFHGLHSRVCLFPSPELCTFSGIVGHDCN